MHPHKHISTSALKQGNALYTVLYKLPYLKGTQNSTAYLALQWKPCMAKHSLYNHTLFTLCSIYQYTEKRQMSGLRSHAINSIELLTGLIITVNTKKNTSPSYFPLVEEELTNYLQSIFTKRSPDGKVTHKLLAADKAFYSYPQHTYV